jgi:hypothetical protein
LIAPERGNNVIQTDGAELRESTGGRQHARIPLTVGVREEVTVEATAQRLDGLDLLLEAINDIVALARVDRLRPARLGELFTLAVGNRAQTALLDLDGESGDTDGGDGEEGCEEVYGEQHRW